MIATPVAVGNLGRLPAEGEYHELVTEADAERREAGPGQLADGLERVCDGGRVTWAIREKQSVGLQLAHFRSTRLGRYHGDFAAGAHELPHDVLLHTVV